jgi:hypothetical protein
MSSTKNKINKTKEKKKAKHDAMTRVYKKYIRKQRVVVLRVHSDIAVVDNTR